MAQGVYSESIMYFMSVPSHPKRKLNERRRVVVKEEKEYVYIKNVYNITYKYTQYS